MKKYTTKQIAELRKLWDIPENFVPIASANGVLAWGVKATGGQL